MRVKVTAVAKSTAKVEYISCGWKDETPGGTGKVELIRLKLAKDPQVRFIKPVPALMGYVERLVEQGFLSIALLNEICVAAYALNLCCRKISLS